MKVRSCVECGKYRYIAARGRCRDCVISYDSLNSFTDNADIFSGIGCQMTIGNVGDYVIRGTQIELDMIENKYNTEKEIYVLDTDSKLKNICTKRGYATSLRGYLQMEKLFNDSRRRRYISLQGLSKLKGKGIIKALKCALSRASEIEKEVSLFINSVKPVLTDKELSKKAKDILQRCRNEDLYVNLVSDNARDFIDAKIHWLLPAVRIHSTIPKKVSRKMGLSDANQKFLSNMTIQSQNIGLIYGDADRGIEPYKMSIK